MSNDGPGATGTLAATPLGALLIYALERKLDGSLVFETGDGVKSALTLRRGGVVNTRLGAPRLRLGEVLVELALVSREIVDEALQQTNGRLLGEALRDQGLPSADLERALCEQQLLHVQAIAGFAPDTVYGFYAGKDFLERWGAPRPFVDPLTAIWRAARSAHNPRAAEVIERLRKLPALRLHRHSRIGRFGFSRKESSLLDVLRAKPSSYDELSKLGLLDPDALSRVLHVLALTRHLELGGDAVPLGVDLSDVRAPRAAGQSNPSVAAGRPQATVVSADQAERRQEIERMYASLDSATYYELLAVAEDADANAIQGGFFQLARRWHPDKLPKELADCADKVTRIFARITEAHKVLSNPSQRAEYDRLSREGIQDEDEQAKVQQVLRAVTAFQKAEVLARRGDWAGAEKLAAQAYEDDSDPAEYAALLAFARTKTGHHDPGFADVLGLLNAAVQKAPKQVRIKLYRAQVLKQAGKVNEAIRDFKAVVEADPANVEAQRELRLFKMRRADAAEEAKSEAPGLLGRLFRKD